MKAAQVEVTPLPYVERAATQEQRRPALFVGANAHRCDWHEKSNSEASKRGRPRTSIGEGRVSSCVASTGKGRTLLTEYALEELQSSEATDGE